MNKNRKERDLSDMIFELTGVEGGDFTKFKINRWGYDNEIITYLGEGDTRKRKSVYLIVRVVGLRDLKSPKRNWGKTGRNKK